MGSNLCCSHHVLGIRTKLHDQEQLSNILQHISSVVPYTDTSVPVRYIKRFKQRQRLYAVGQVQEMSTS